MVCIEVSISLLVIILNKVAFASFSPAAPPSRIRERSSRQFSLPFSYNKKIFDVRVWKEKSRIRPNDENKNNNNDGRSSHQFVETSYNLSVDSSSDFDDDGLGDDSNDEAGAYDGIVEHHTISVEAVDAAVVAPSRPLSWTTTFLPTLLRATARGTVVRVRRLASRYDGALTRRPLRTNALTAGTIGLVGDGLSQWFERVFEPLLVVTAAATTTATYDYRRTVAVGCEGLLVSGPLMYYAYRQFERVLPVSSSSSGDADDAAKRGRLGGSVAAAVQTAVDCLVLDPCYVLSAMVCAGLFEGQSFAHQLVPQVVHEFVPTVRAAWASSFLLSPIQFLSFRFLPVRLRVFAMALQSVLWNAVVFYMTHRSRRGFVTLV